MEASAQQLREIDITLIEISGANPRKNIKGESFKELKASIEEHGVLEPLVVRPKGDKYELVAGERRYTAAKDLKLEFVPVAVRELDDATARMVMLLENLQREDLEPLEEAAALEEILATGITQEELAKKVSKSQPWVANRLRLLKAPMELRKHLQDGEITPQHIVALLPFVDRDELKEEVLAGVQHAVQNAKQSWGSPFTVDDAKQLGEEVVGEYGTCLDPPDYCDYLTKHFDFTGCDACKSMVAVAPEDGGKEKDRYCLNEGCFAARRKVAEEKFQASRAKKEASQAKNAAEGKTSLKNLRYGQYERINGSEIDTSGCKDCGKCVVDSKGEVAYTKGTKICLDPSCYRGKKSAKSRVRNKQVRDAVARTENAAKEYLQGRQAGFTLDELKYIHEWMRDKATYRAKPKALGSLQTAKDLEDSIINCILQDELAPVKYSHDEDELRHIQKALPFKVPKASKTPDKKTTKPKKAKCQKGA